MISWSFLSKSTKFFFYKNQKLKIRIFCFVLNWKSFVFSFAYVRVYVRISRIILIYIFSIFLSFTSPYFLVLSWSSEISEQRSSFFSSLHLTLTLSPTLLIHFFFRTSKISKNNQKIIYIFCIDLCVLRCLRCFFFSFLLGKNRCPFR